MTLFLNRIILLVDDEDMKAEKVGMKVVSSYGGERALNFGIPGAKISIADIRLSRFFVDNAVDV